MMDRFTDVTVPLSRDVALLGRFEEVDAISCASALEVAALNSRTFSNDKRFVYSAREDFLLLGPGDQLLSGAEKFECWDAA
jgi:hypothetical protein